eukprot:2695742-Pleurochrysis_carterae.AAC.3
MHMCASVQRFCARMCVRASPCACTRAFSRLRACTGADAVSLGSVELGEGERERAHACVQQSEATEREAQGQSRAGRAMEEAREPREVRGARGVKEARWVRERRASAWECRVSGSSIDGGAGASNVLA